MTVRFFDEAVERHRIELLKGVAKVLALALSVGVVAVTGFYLAVVAYDAGTQFAHDRAVNTCIANVDFDDAASTAKIARCRRQ